VADECTDVCRRQVNGHPEMSALRLRSNVKGLVRSPLAMPASCQVTCIWTSALLLTVAACGGDVEGTSAKSCVAPYLNDQPPDGPPQGLARTISPGKSLAIYGHWYTTTCNDTGGDDPHQPMPAVHLTLALRRNRPSTRQVHARRPRHGLLHEDRNTGRNADRNRHSHRRPEAARDLHLRDPGLRPRAWPALPGCSPQSADHLPAPSRAVTG
jgi:hypothetical protein